ncbi:MAG TPA: SpoIID/LytB domain-containing protein [Humisphaera sp.]|nr:SpoIID/LytB domain-containing protein [Humisphaera sp.]
MARNARRIGQRLSRPYTLGGVIATLGLLVVVLPISCSQGCNHNNPELGTAPLGTPSVRVLVRENVTQAAITATQPPNMRIGGSAARPVNLARGASVNVTLRPSGWTIGTAVLGAGELILEPSVEGSLRVDGQAYRGRLRFVPMGGPGKFDVINDVDVDGYVMSVVPKEMFPQWHPEAYRAQAIVARTYALYVAHTASAGAQFDLFADTRSQVYGGIGSETPKSREAVDVTRGIVVAHGPPGQEKVFKAYFSSCCGGVTQSAADAFGEPYQQALSEQNIGPRCTESPRFNWPTITMRKTELTRRIRQWGVNNNEPEKSIADISRIDIESNNQFGRPRRFIITDVRGNRYSLNSEDFRHAVNTDATDHVTLGSSFCKPVNDPTQIRFTEGHGFGHGVGLCQWCAEHEAASGVRHETIVLSAFPGTKLVRAY